jgi:antitoxin component of MazEF toxin-antitoxin module
MRTTKKLLQIGDSVGFILNKNLLTYLNVKKGDLIEIEIKRVE